MKLLRRLLTFEPSADDRRKDTAERLRRQHEIEEEHRKRLQLRLANLGLICF